MGGHNHSSNAVCWQGGLLALALVAAATPAFAQNAAMEAAARQIGSACRGDAMQHCRGLRPGDGKILACLEGRLDQLTPACRAKIPEAIALRDQAAGSGQSGN